MGYRDKAGRLWLGIGILGILGILAVLPPALAAKAKAKAKGGKPQKGRLLHIIPVDSLFQVNEAAVSAHAKIFLVAGSSQAASFAREIVAQKKTVAVVGL